MKILNCQIIKNIAKIVVLAMFFYACSPSEQEGFSVNFYEVAQGIGKELVIKHTDSGRLSAELITPLMKDFTHISFPYYEFPEGVELIIYDKNGGTSRVFADHAVQYDATKIVDMKGNVRVITADSTRLTAPQLYWNQALHWVYTDEPYNITFKNGAKNKGEGFDANEDFTNFKSRSNIGTQILED